MGVDGDEEEGRPEMAKFSSNTYETKLGLLGRAGAPPRRAVKVSLIRCDMVVNAAYRIYQKYEIERKLQTRRALIQLIERWQFHGRARLSLAFGDRLLSVLLSFA